jgi:hypothetical protein
MQNQGLKHCFWIFRTKNNTEKWEGGTDVSNPSWLSSSHVEWGRASRKIRSGIWTECASNTTFYSKILVTRVTKKSPRELLFGKEAHGANNLRMFGEMSIVTTKNKIQGNPKGRGTVCMFVDNLQMMLVMFTRCLTSRQNISSSQDILCG